MTPEIIAQVVSKAVCETIIQFVVPVLIFIIVVLWIKDTAARERSRRRESENNDDKQS